MAVDNSELSGLQKGLAFIYSLVLLVANLLIANEAWSALKLLQQTEQRFFYMDIMPFALAALWLVPVMLMLSYILLTRALSVLPQLNVDKLLKAALPCLLLLLVSRVAIGFYLGDYLPSKGFIYCDKLSRTAAFSGQIWVSKQAYCHDESYLVNTEVLEWFDEQQSAGTMPSNDEVTAQIELFIAEYKQRYQ
ncbi:hypothetical protein ORJ00_07935 [Rheinheimera baltica]|uniref:hypothetical protein n=1 Tax=Rheinheimera baltica TaxID=67576 RepID=UPI00273F6A66|nr:hypothetical protein [Rheinheimera baltica]MDP5142664.1 hypothetical protein [Rheinheimera baltica]